MKKKGSNSTTGSVSSVFVEIKIGDKAFNVNIQNPKPEKEYSKDKTKFFLLQLEEILYYWCYVLFQS